jgi:hypothetical protein
MPRKPADDAAAGLRHAAAAMPIRLPPQRALRALCVAATSALVASGCSSVRLDPPAPAVAPTPAATPTDIERYPAPQPRVWTQPPVDTPLPALAREAPLTAQPAAVAVPALADAAPIAATPAVQAPAPAPAPAASASTAAATPSAAMPTAQPTAAAAAPRPPTGAARPSVDLPPGRWSVQVGVFAIAANAETLRERVAQRLPGTAVRTVQRNARVHVLAGDAPDRATAERLAQQLRTALQQDVVLFRW